MFDIKKERDGSVLPNEENFYQKFEAATYIRGRFFRDNEKYLEDVEVERTAEEDLEKGFHVFRDYRRLCQGYKIVSTSSNALKFTIRA